LEEELGHFGNPRKTDEKTQVPQIAYYDTSGENYRNGLKNGKRVPFAERKR
jgi:hypothetical protein